MSDPISNNPHTGGHGEHPTVAGNMFDPNVSADGMKGGVGVGGTAENRVREEGAEHVQEHGYGDDRGVVHGHHSGSGLGSNEPGYGQQHGSGIDHIKQASGVGSGTGSGYQSGTGSGLGHSGTGSGVASAADYQGTGSGLSQGGSGLTGDNTGSGMGSDYQSGAGSGLRDTTSGTSGHHHHNDNTPGSYPSDSTTGYGNQSGSSTYNPSSSTTGYGSEPGDSASYNNQTGQTPSMMDRMKNAVGYGNPSSTTSTSNTGNDNLPGDTGSGLTDRSRDTTGATGYGSEPATGSGYGNTSGYDNQSNTPGHHGSHAGTAAGAGLGAAGAGAAAEDVASRHHGDHHGSTTGRNDVPSTSTSTDPMKNTSSNAAPVTDSNVRTGNEPTTSADPTTADTAQGQSTGSGRTDTKDTSEESGHGGTATASHQPTEAEAKNDSDGKGGPPASIPMAGGERIGAKHWGESKVITDRDPPKESMPSHNDDLTKKNTETNTENKTGEKDGAQKESMVDKIKDKLHMSHK